MSKDILTNKDLQINSQTKFLSNKPWKKHIIQTKTPKRKYVPKIFTKNSLQGNPYRKSQKSNSRPNKYWRTFFSKKYPKRKCLPRSLKDVTTKKYVTKFSAKEPLKRHSLPKAWRKESPTKQNETIFGRNLFGINFSPESSDIVLIEISLFWVDCFFQYFFGKGVCRILFGIDFSSESVW